MLRATSVTQTYRTPFFQCRYILMLDVGNTVMNLPPMTPAILLKLVHLCMLFIHQLRLAGEKVTWANKPTKAVIMLRFQN